MLSSLYINNIAVIKEASIDLSNGFTSLTGETGAGKSIIIDAISAILGGRVSKDLIRTGSDNAKIIAMFSNVDSFVKDKLNEFDIEISGDEFRIYRELKSSGKTICKIDSVPVTVSMLKELGVLLVSILGQHDSYELLSPEVHGKYLDNYAKLDDLIKQYQFNFSHLKEIKNEIDELSIEENQKEARLDFLRYKIEEIEEIGIRVGEKQELTDRKKLIKGIEDVSKAIISSISLIDGGEFDDGMLSCTDSVSTELENASDSMPALTDIAKRMRDIEYELQDISSELHAIEKDSYFDGDELEFIESRIESIYKLNLKYGDTEEKILESLENAREEIKNIEFSEEKLLILSEEFETVKAKTVELAKELSKKRKSAANEFSQKVKRELQFLNMPNVEFSIVLERVTLNSLGCDKISFMVSPNIGEDLKPMVKIASGGELSRIMLAIKTVLSSGDSISTMIFDEIDAGISGEAANKVGQKLKEVSNNRQVLCITHLAQIAAMSDNQILITKNSVNGETITNLKTLSKNERIDELARIIGGDGITDLQRKMAKEMLM